MIWSTPPKEVSDAYRHKCTHYSKGDWSNFKRDKKYNTILEGNEKEVGVIAYKSIKKLGGLKILEDNLEKFRENETVGNPEIMLLNDIQIAPSTLRYVNTALEIKTLIKDPKKIIEIGGGYGGLCKTMSVLFNWDSYTIIEIPEAVPLCNRYLEHFNLNAHAVPFFDEEADLVIADSSLAECNKETQRMYAKLINKAKCAYVVYNTLGCEEGAKNWLTFAPLVLENFNARIEHVHDQFGGVVPHIIIMYLYK